MLSSVFGMPAPSGSGPTSDELRQTRLRDVLRADLKRLNDRLPGPERERLGLYATAIEDFDRRRELRASIRCDAPMGPSGDGPGAHFEAMFDLATLGLKCGLTNVVGIAVGTGGQPRHNDHMPAYEDIGEIGSHDWNADRLLAMHRFHAGLVERLWTELINTPRSGGGTLADETVIMYSPTNGFTDDGSHHSISLGDKNRAEWASLLLSRVPGLRSAGDYIYFNSKARARTVAEMFHALSQSVGVDPSAFGKGSNGDGDFHAPLEALLA
jgi:hypothetical protein